MTGAATTRPPSVTTERTALDAAPMAIWEEDFSAIADFCAQQRHEGIVDIEAFLDEHPFALADLVGSIRVVDVNEMAMQLAGAADKESMLGPIPPELLSEDSWGTFVDQVRCIFEGCDRLTSESRGVDLEGRPTWHTVHWAAPTIDGAVDYSRVLVMVEDTTSHHVAAMQREIHERELRALIEIGSQVASTLDEERVFRTIVETAAELTGSEQAVILLFDQRTETLTTAFGHAVDDADLSTYSYGEVMDGISGWVCRHLSATTSDDISTDARNGGLAKRRAASNPGTSAAVAPVLQNGVVLGTLTVFNGPDSPPFTARQLSLIETLASQAAVAINNARIYEEIQRSHEDLSAAHRELTDAQTQLLAAQKLEAIGSLAAGIAHEINTPIQYVGDNIRFLQESALAVGKLLQVLGPLVDQVADGAGTSELVERYRTMAEEADLEFIQEEVPLAIDQSLEGIERVAEIVRAMKEFAHPGTEDKAPVDLNRSIETTVAVARNEWKYVADVVFDLDPDMPPVPALAGPLNQSLLIMIVNAAQALEDTVDTANGERGTISLSTRVDGSDAVIRVADNGPGIPEAVLDRIFDPFFTTKEVGKGSGQGLSIARSVVVDKHGGRLDVETAPRQGAAFVIRLPLDSERTS